jgi:hypothetical protein
MTTTFFWLGKSREHEAGAPRGDFLHEAQLSGFELSDLSAHFDFVFFFSFFSLTFCLWAEWNGMENGQAKSRRNGMEWEWKKCPFQTSPRRTESACLNASLCETTFSGQSCRRFKSFGHQSDRPILFASLKDDVMVALAFDSLNSALETERSKKCSSSMSQERTAVRKSECKQCN